MNIGKKIYTINDTYTATNSFGYGNDSISRQVYTQIDNCIWNQIDTQIDNQICGRIYITMENEYR